MDQRRDNQNKSSRQAAIVNNTKRRRRRRRRLKVQFYIMLFTIVVCTIVALSLTVMFPIETVTVEGKSRYSVKEIINASAINIGNNIFTSDTDVAKERIETTLPYIDGVKIKRKLPSEIKISVIQTAPACVYDDEAIFILVSDSGKILEKVVDKPLDLTYIKGAQINDPTIGYKITFSDNNQKILLDNLLEGIKANNLNVSYIDINDNADIKLLIENRILAELGSAADLEYKISHLCTVLKELEPEKRGTLILKSASFDNKKSTFREGDFTLA